MSLSAAQYLVRRRLAAAIPALEAHHAINAKTGKPYPDGFRSSSPITPPKFLASMPKRIFGTLTRNGSLCEANNFPDGMLKSLRQARQRNRAAFDLLMVTNGPISSSPTRPIIDGQ